MTNEQYTLTFFLNATHKVVIDGKESSQHPHTFEIECDIDAEKFTEFEIMENNINSVLNQLNDQYLNDLESFKNQSPTLENISRFLFTTISSNLATINCHLLKIKVAESPVRAFTIKIQDK